MINTCNTCKKDFVKTHNKNRVYKYCSIKCSTSNLGKIKNFSEKMRGRRAWNKGIKGRQDWHDISGLKPGWNKGIPNTYIMGDKNHNWKDGITPINKAIRHSIEYKTWRMAVLRRDYFSCINCGHKANGQYKDVIVDHIKPFSLYPEMRLAIENGRTLCMKCDSELGWNYHRKVVTEA